MVMDVSNYHEYRTPKTPFLSRTPPAHLSADVSESSISTTISDRSGNSSLSWLSLTAVEYKEQQKTTTCESGNSSISSISSSSSDDEERRVIALLETESSIHTLIDTLKQHSGIQQTEDLNHEDHEYDYLHILTISQNHINQIVRSRSCNISVETV
jgi:hypothetical protein